MSIFARKTRRTAERNFIESWRTRSGTPNGDAANGSDLLVPSSFPTAAELAGLEEVRRELITFIDDAAARKALDEGTPYFADQWIQAKLVGWLQLLETEYQLRADSASWIVARRTRNLTVAYGTLLSLRAELTEVENGLRQQAAVLTGTEPTATLDVPTPDQVAADLRRLPAATQLTGHSLVTAEASLDAVPVHTQKS